MSPTRHALTLLSAAALLIAGCQSTPNGSGDADGAASKSAASPTTADTPLARQLQGPAPKSRPSEETIEKAFGEYRWDEWKQLPMALEFNATQQTAWDKLTDAWSKRKAAGENASKIRAELLSNLSQDQQQYWVRYVLYRSARYRMRSDGLSEAQHAKLWSAAQSPATKLHNAGVLQSNPYMKDIGDQVDKVASAVK